MERAEHRVAFPNRVLEIILVDLEVARDRPEDLEARAVERGEKLLERIPEARHLRRPEVVGHVVAKFMARREIAPHVPELLEVVRLVPFGGLDPERSVAAGAPAARD